MKTRAAIFTVCAVLAVLLQTAEGQYTPWREFLKIDQQRRQHLNYVDRLDGDYSADSLDSYVDTYAWFEAVNLDCYLDAFLIFGDISYLNLVRGRIDTMFSHLDSERKIRSYEPNNGIWIRAGIDTTTPYPVWSDIEPFKTGGGRQGFIVCAYILAPIARYGHLVQENNIEGEHAASAAHFMNKVKAVIDHLDSWAYYRSSGYSYYIKVPKPSPPPTAWNYMTMAAVVHKYLSLWKGFDKPVRLHHSNRANELADYFKSQLYMDENGYKWKYTPRARMAQLHRLASTDSSDSYWWEDISHAAADVRMVSLFYDLNDVFTATDIDRFCDRIISLIHIKAETASIDYYLNGQTSTPGIESKWKWRYWDQESMAHQKRHKLALAQWLSLAVKPNHFRNDVLTAIYKIGNQYRGYAYAGHALLKMMTRLALALTPKNIDFELTDAVKKTSHPPVDSLPKYWIPFYTKKHSGVRFLNTDAGKPYGKCAALYKTAYTDDGWYGYRQTVAVIPATRYTFSARVRLRCDRDCKSDTAAIALVFMQKNMPSRIEKGYISANQDSTWQSCTITCTSPDNIDKNDKLLIQLYVNQDFKGMVQFDSTSLTLGKK